MVLHAALQNVRCCLTHARTLPAGLFKPSALHVACDDLLPYSCIARCRSVQAECIARAAQARARVPSFGLAKHVEVRTVRTEVR
eukprot:3106483-Alexandrium_andersonii.AAC.1